MEGDPDVQYQDDGSYIINNKTYVSKDLVYGEYQ